VKTQTAIYQGPGRSRERVPKESAPPPQIALGVGNEGADRGFISRGADRRDQCSEHRPLGKEPGYDPRNTRHQGRLQISQEKKSAGDRGKARQGTASRGE